MKNSGYNYSSPEGCAERVSVKNEFVSIVKQYSKIIDMIESSHQTEITTKAAAKDEEESIKKIFNKFKMT